MITLTTQKKSAITAGLQHHAAIAKLIEDCYLEESIDKKVQILYTINSLLPKTYHIAIPSLITSDYIDSALYRIEKIIYNIVSSTYSQSRNKDAVKTNSTLGYVDS